MPNYLTREGLERLKKELEELKMVKRQEISERLQRAISFGDLSENAEYQEAKQDQANLETKIVELEELIGSAAIIDEELRDRTVIGVGSTFVAKQIDPPQELEMRFTIVGSEETDPAKGFISNVSPLGAAFLGKQAGSEVVVKTPTGDKKYTIVRVEK